MPHNFKTALIIEDDHDLRVSLRQVFEAAGFYVFTVTNGYNALELLKVIPPPKLMLCDLNMPIMDGKAFVDQKIKSESLRDVPLIIMSAQKERFCDFPAVTCMAKPLDIHQLIKTAEELVGPHPLIMKR